MKRRVLVYTDSRGQHTPSGAPVHDVFGLKLAQHTDLEVEVVLCPMKWMTTVDFLDYLRQDPASNYDWVVLQTGIVDWSPRPQQSAINDLYNNLAPSNLGNSNLNTRDYSKKVVNNKKPSFDALFEEQAMVEYLGNGFDVEYEGQATVNMYGLEMAERYLLPRLAEIDNLIFVNSNRFVPGWEGDFKRGRPANISITEQYSELFRDILGPEKVIDLLQWQHDEVKRFTCDNLHLTKEGSDWIYDRICEKMDITDQQKNEPNGATNGRTIFGAAPIVPFGRPIEPPQVITEVDRQKLFDSLKIRDGQKLATLIIGLRITDPNDKRTENLKFLLSWIDQFYHDVFEILIIEQDETSKKSMISGQISSTIRWEFIFNPYAYNRGWGYNCAIKHFTNSDVVALMDTDVLPGGNFLDEVIDCYKNNYSVISPYTNVYFTNSNEATNVAQSCNFSDLNDHNRINKPTSITGGIAIIRRELYDDVCGFEQYTSYGGEDRALDVTLLRLCPPEKIRMAPYTYTHLYHPSDKIDNMQLKMLLSDLENHYGCTVDRSLTAEDSIHKNCQHVSAQKVSENIAFRRSAYGDLNLYRSDKPLTINGCFMENSVALENDVIFPPAFQGLDDYDRREVYDAPAADSNRLSALYNAFQGKRCFIIGNGPSLNQHDLSLLEGEYVFAVNSFYYKTDETGFRPTFYVVEDNAVMKENIEQIRSYEAPYKFFPTIYKNLHGEGDNVFFFNMNRGFYEKSSPNYCIPRFSTDSSRVLYCGQSVTYINLQLAFFLGFTEVYLIGMDFDYIIPKEHMRNGDLIVSTTDDPNHFHKDYFGKGKTWKDPKLERVAMNYRQAKLSYEAVGRKIYNATIGGKLEIFERIGYEELLRAPLARGGKPALSNNTSSDANETIAVFENRAAASLKRSVPVELPNLSLLSATKSQSSRKRSSKFAKLKRDPHAFFRDSRSPVLRPMQYLFRPSKLTKAQVEMLERAGPVAGTQGLISRLPASRRMIFETRRRMKDGQAQLAKLQKDLRADFDKSRGDLRLAIDKSREDSRTDLLKLQADLKQKIRELEDGLAALSGKMEREIEGVEVMSRGALSAFKSTFDRDRRISAPANAPLWRVHDRYLSQADIAHIQKNWLRSFGLRFSPSQLGYLAHHIGLAEERCEGHMPVMIQAAVLRALALMSLERDEIELLEVRTVFGIGAGILYQAAARSRKSMKLTLIHSADENDAPAFNDELTGVPLSRVTIEGNLRALGVSDNDYRLFSESSARSDVVKAISDREYDYLIIGGVDGLNDLAANFELFSPMVKPGGVLIFDDYGASDWPAIRSFVDDNVRSDEDWLWIGGDWLTGVLRKKSNIRTSVSREQALSVGALE